MIISYTHDDWFILIIDLPITLKILSLIVLNTRHCYLFAIYIRDTFSPPLVTHKMSLLTITRDFTTFQRLVIDYCYLLKLVVNVTRCQ